MANAGLKNPGQACNKHQTRARPRDSLEFGTAICLDADLFAVFVDRIAPFDDDRRDYGARYSDGEECQERNKDVEEGDKTARGENTSERDQEGNEYETYADAV